MSRIRHDSVAASFKCPGCGDTHRVPTGGDGWGWNGSVDSPTLTPSILVRSGHYALHWKPGDSCWCGRGYGYECTVCHSFVTNGRIAFLNDCTHHLAGKTVDLTEIIP